MPRYVILLHELPPGHALETARGTHWDLMLETDQGLRTWALLSEPAGGAAIEGEQLPDHRPAYLDYEGPVSGNRGQVSRWDAGKYEIELQSDEALRITLRGQRGLATARLEKAEGTHFWRVSFSADPTSG
jgi:hypothetical protein